MWRMPSILSLNWNEETLSNCPSPQNSPFAAQLLQRLRVLYEAKARTRTSLLQWYVTVKRPKIIPLILFRKNLPLLLAGQARPGKNLFLTRYFYYAYDTYSTSITRSSRISQAGCEIGCQDAKRDTNQGKKEIGEKRREGAERMSWDCGGLPAGGIKQSSQWKILQLLWHFPFSCSIRQLNIFHSLTRIDNSSIRQEAPSRLVSGG